MGSTIIQFKNAYLGYSTRNGFFSRQIRPVVHGVNLDITAGEKVGIIGGNGSGKSTMLKAMCGLIKPYSGEYHCYANQVSLLRLSLGFDYNLNALDNILFVGMLMGYSKKTVIDCTPEIIEYSELGEYIYAPLKTYSSGMLARLGFSISVNLHTDLMLIDEVLAVGDERFMRKAEVTMREKFASNQTIILVSHIEQHLKTFCERLIWIHDGLICADGEPEDVILKYRQAV